MGILDFFKGQANPKQALPLPISQSRDFRFGGSANGALMSMLRRSLPGSHKDWSKIAGDLGLNGVVAVSMDWYVRNLHQCQPKVMRANADGGADEVPDHPALKVINNPDPRYTYSSWWGMVLQDYKLFGNAYIFMLKNASGVDYLQFMPQDMVRPAGNGATPLTKYIYTTDGRQFDCAIEDVIHLRYGRDPLDIRMGRSPLQAVLREIAADNVASSTAYALLANGGNPSLVIGPDGKDASVDIDAQSARALKRQLREDLTGDNAGGIVVMNGPYKMDKVSWSPSDLALDSIRRVPEERICSAMGLNPMVLGLGSGLERSTYSNFERAQQAAWEDGMIPLLRALSDVLTQVLLPMFAETQEGDYVEFDLAQVRALADDLTNNAARAEKLYMAGIIDKAEAMRIAGIEPTVTDEGVFHLDAYPTTQTWSGATAQNPSKSICTHDSTPEVVRSQSPFYTWTEGQ
jgi:HK97 family phage portal protein